MTIDIATKRPRDGGGLQCEFNILESLGYVILWIILCIFTIGIGLFVMPYYFYKAILNKTWIVNASGEKIYRFQCDLNIFEMIGHIILWIILTVITLGIALIFYYFRTLRLCINRTYLQRI
ncbi:DUF898 family protein [Oricola thermophila]|uniref:DUF898 family protein n=2 Tax=Oricola thermophila TaxID=2742145 RepID=A0A6N1VE73_9HYPH|nr:DUF6693 family protein [Oricola thermophila]QKV19226.1 DUF898 family protein [Oricola thermophila]